MFVEYETVVEVTPDASGDPADATPVAHPQPARTAPHARPCSDVLRPEELGLDRPDRREDTVVCRPGPGQREYVGSLGARVDKIRREQVRSEPGGDNMLAVCGDGRRVALDPQLVGVRERSSKIDAMADHVARIHDEHAEQAFPGSDVPRRAAGDLLRSGHARRRRPADLRPAADRARRSAGMPAERIRWVHEATTSEQRTQLFAACRSGEVSVLIGSTDKLGVGTNIQTRLRAVHHADAPWRPSDIEQREGRAFRPGNLNPVVDVLRYVTKGTFDAYMWQTLQRKAAFIDQLYRTDPGTRAVDDLGDAVLTYAEVKALATGNALLLDQAQAAADVARLRLLRSINLQSLTARAPPARRRPSRTSIACTSRRSCSARLASGWPRTAVGTDPEADVRLAARALRERLLVPGTDDDPAPIRAPWRGLGVELIPLGGWSASAADDASNCASRSRIAASTTSRCRSPWCAAAPRRPRSRSSPRYGSWHDRLDARIAEVEQAALDAYDASEQAKRVIHEHRFTRADELAAAEARLAEITTALESSVSHKGDERRLSVLMLVACTCPTTSPLRPTTP